MSHFDHTMSHYEPLQPHYEPLWAIMSHDEPLWATISHFNHTMSHYEPLQPHYEPLWATSTTQPHYERVLRRHHRLFEQKWMNWTVLKKNAKHAMWWWGRGREREVRVRNGHWGGSLSPSCPPLLLSFLRFEAKGEGKSVSPTNRPTDRPVWHSGEIWWNPLISAEIRGEILWNSGNTV